MRVALLLLVAACGGTVSYPLPMTAAQAIQYDTGGALVAYLGQPDASPEICDARSTGPHVTSLPPATRTALVDSLRTGTVTPLVWRRCVNVLLKRLSTADADDLLDTMLAAYRRMVTSHAIDRDPAAATRLGTLHRLYLDRKAGRDPHPAVLASLRKTLGTHALGPTAAQFARELLDTIDLEHGTWHGAPVTVATMDALAASGNEVTLRRFLERLPTEALRTEARRRVIRIHMVLSPFAEVRDGGAAVEDAVVATGHNAVSLTAHPVVRAWLDAPARAVVVQQHVFQRTATLLAIAPGGHDPRVIAALDLHGALHAELAGLSRPVTACDHARALDPSPCLGTADLAVDTSLATIDPDGTVRVADMVPTAALPPLARAADFALGVRVGDQVASVHWPLTFARPDSLIFRGPIPAGTGARPRRRARRAARRSRRSRRSPPGRGRGGGQRRWQLPRDRRGGRRRGVRGPERRRRGRGRQRRRRGYTGRGGRHVRRWPARR